MPTKPVTPSASRQRQRGTLKKRTTRTRSQPPAPMRPSHPRQGSPPTLSPTRFTASTRKLLSRYAHALQACIRNGQHLTAGDYGRILRDLEALQDATAKVVTDLALMAGES